MTHCRNIDNHLGLPVYEMYTIEKKKKSTTIKTQFLYLFLNGVHKNNGSYSFSQGWTVSFLRLALNSHNL